MDIARTAGDGDQPVKIVLHMRARPGTRDALEAWIRELVELASQSADLAGSSVVTTGRDEFIVLLRFTSQSRLEQWESSPAVRSLLQRGEPLMHAVEEPVRRMGLETWFTLPGLPAPAKAPPGWKMALVTWLALLPQVIALGFIIPASWPMLAGAVVGTVIPVSMLQWVVMPRLTKLLYGWLYAADPSVTRVLSAAPSAGKSSAS